MRLSKKHFTDYEGWAAQLQQAWEKAFDAVGWSIQSGSKLDYTNLGNRLAAGQNAHWKGVIPKPSVITLTSDAYFVSIPNTRPHVENLALKTGVELETDLKEATLPIWTNCNGWREIRGKKIRAIEWGGFWGNVPIYKAKSRKLFFALILGKLLYIGREPRDLLLKPLLEACSEKGKLNTSSEAALNLSDCTLSQELFDVATEALKGLK